MTDADDTVALWKKRVCFEGLIKGLAGMDGGHPLCLGSACSLWEQCLLNSMAWQRDIDDLLYQNARYAKPAKRQPRKIAGLSYGMVLLISFIRDRMRSAKWDREVLHADEERPDELSTRFSLRRLK